MKFLMFLKKACKESHTIFQLCVCTENMSIDTTNGCLLSRESECDPVVQAAGTRFAMIQFRYISGELAISVELLEEMEFWELVHLLEGAHDNRGRVIESFLPPDLRLAHVLRMGWCKCQCNDTVYTLYCSLKIPADACFTLVWNQKVCDVVCRLQSDSLCEDTFHLESVLINYRDVQTSCCDFAVVLREKITDAMTLKDSLLRWVVQALEELGEARFLAYSGEDMPGLICEITVVPTLEESKRMAPKLVHHGPWEPYLYRQAENPWQKLFMVTADTLELKILEERLRISPVGAKFLKYVFQDPAGQRRRL